MIIKNQTNKYLAILTTLILSMCVLVYTGCATGSYEAYDYDYSIMDIQKIIVENLPEGLGATNPNRRVFYSKKFTVNREKKRAIPLVMRVVINGDRRPYGLGVEVRKVSPDIDNVQEAFDFGSSFKGQISLAKRVVNKIDSDLAKRRKSKNMFDDFKPF